MFTYHIPFHKVKLNIIEFLSLNSNFQSFIFQYNRARLQLCGHVIMPKIVVVSRVTRGHLFGNWDAT